jgi:hypothetical protein
MNLIAISALTLLLHSKFAIAGLNENERIEEYYRRGNTWPPAENDFKPPTKGWKQLNKRRFKQLEYLEDNNRKRYEGYMQSVYSALISKNFTEYGWGVTRAPQAVIDKLKKRLNDGMKNDKYDFEHETDVIETESRPLFFRDQVMNREIVEEMLPLHEAWSGVELVPNNAYGLRVYRNDTNLNMHLDKKETHVISSILHVDHGENDDPWPIVIEDFHGNTNEVFLESGDMLFYESSKLVHGRPKKMNGEYYSSLFSHYYPKDWNPDELELDMHYRIPEYDIWGFSKERVDDDFDNLIFAGLSLKEPDCENAWCGLKGSIKWNGPGPGYGKVLSGDGIITTLSPIPTEDSFWGNQKDNNIDEAEDEL